MALMGISCSQNIFTDASSSKTSDESLIKQARMAIDKQDYQTAIEILTLQLSTSGQATEEAKQVLAYGYAGKCGFNFLNYMNSLSTATSGSAFTILKTPFVGTVVEPNSCLSALTQINSIAPSAQRTNDQNVFAAFVGMALMGSATRLYTDESPSTGDGTIDSATIACDLTDAQVDLIILGFGFMSENFTYLSAAQLGSSSQSTLNTFMSTCNTVSGGACAFTDPALITAPLRIAIKNLLNTTEYGVGSVVTAGNPILIGLACP